MDVSFVATSPESLRTGLLIVPVLEGDKPLPFQKEGMKPEHGELYLLYEGWGRCSRVLLVGLGKKGDLTLERVRRAFGKAVKKVKDLNLEEAAVWFRPLPGLKSDSAAAAVMEGLALGAYVFDKYKTKKEGERQLRHVVFAGATMLKAAVLEAKLVCDHVNMVRDMANENADVMTTERLASFARDIAKAHRLKATIIERPQLRKLGMNLLLAVGQGSRYPPKLIILEYAGDPQSRERIALVGKGITFDSGGLNLKPSGYIETMKQDMTGAATVLAVTKLAAALKLRVNVAAVAPVCENMIGPSAYKPGDVIRSYAGKTVEVENTDAEGRLILADAIAYAEKHLKPVQIIDIATLTGAASVILGEYGTILMGEGKYKKALVEAGERTSDRVWELPVYEEFMEEVKSEIADVRNLGYNKRFAGTLMGAAFLKSFADKVPLIHLDIGGTAWAEKGRDYVPKNATGVGVRLLAEFLKAVAK